MPSYPRFDKDCQQASLELIRAAKALDIPLEYNLAGLTPIPGAAPRLPHARLLGDGGRGGRQPSSA